MPVSVDLQHDRRIIVAMWENPVIQDDFMKVFKILEPIYHEATLPVHSIYLADNLTNLPPRAISTFLRDARSPLVNPMAGIMIVVSTKMFIRSIVETAAKMRPVGKLTTAVTFEEALAKIEAALQEERHPEFPPK